MPWIEAVLRGQKVLARAKSDGTLQAEAGRVEIRYEGGSGRAYRAAAKNLEVAAGSALRSDETVSEPVATKPKASAFGGEKAARASSSQGWVAYTDGACSGNPGPAGCGIVLVSPDGRMHEGLEYLGVATNNVAELTAILRAVEWAPIGAALVVHTDSQYAIGVLQKGWKAKANQALIANARSVITTRGAHLVYVPGHRGVALNERADELAREAVQTQRSRPAASVHPQGS